MLQLLCLRCKHVCLLRMGTRLQMLLLLHLLCLLRVCLALSSQPLLLNMLLDWDTDRARRALTLLVMLQQLP